MEKHSFTEAELTQLRLIIRNIHLTMNAMSPGTRELLHKHGFSAGKFQGFKRGSYKLLKALEGILQVKVS